MNRNITHCRRIHLPLRRALPPAAARAAVTRFAPRISCYRRAPSAELYGCYINQPCYPRRSELATALSIKFKSNHSTSITIKMNSLDSPMCWDMDVSC